MLSRPQSHLSSQITNDEQMLHKIKHKILLVLMKTGQTSVNHEVIKRLLLNMTYLGN